MNTYFIYARYCNAGLHIAEDLRQLVSKLGSKENSRGFLSISAQHFMLADNLAACSSGQNDEAVEASVLLEEHWRLLKPSNAFDDEDLSEGTGSSLTPDPN